MNCPACDEPMVVLELDEVEIDYCIECEGIWLDSGELEMLLESSAAKDGFLSSFARDECGAETARKCPMCGKVMKKALYTGNRRIRIDRCPESDGIWLDKGELREILEEAGDGEKGRVLDLLRKVFADKPQ